MLWMNKMKIEISCCLCSEEYQTEIDLPATWTTRYSSIYAEDGFCPKHIKVAEFASSQCQGCVGEWGDCALWRSFAYSGHRNITERDLEIIETGICPKRTNGTISFSFINGMNDIDISERAKTESGIAFADAIKEYMEKYPG